jgi:putative ABC transport system permease protein
MNNIRLKIALRTLWKQRFYTALNITGLSLGMAVGILVFQFIRFHLNYDRQHPDANRLYKIVTEVHLPDGSIVHDAGSPLALSKTLKSIVPGIEEETVFLSLRSATVTVAGVAETNYFAEHNIIAFADPQSFGLFDFTVVKGEKIPLSEPNTVAITERLAKKYFGTHDATGKTLQLDNKLPLTVTSILKDRPENTELGFEMLVSRSSFRNFNAALEQQMTSSWGFINSTTHSFIRLPESSDPKKVETAMRDLAKQYFDPGVADAYRFRLLTLTDLHFDGRYGGTIRRSLLTTLALAGTFLVIIACFNFINLASSQSIRRSKEIGTRKVLGGTPASVFWQFITETAFTVMLSALLSFLWIAFCLPLVNNWLQTTLQINPFQDATLALALVILIIVLTVASGAYPAIILSGYKPIEALKLQRSQNGTKTYRKGLVVLQNMIVQGLIICTVVILLQVNHIKNADLGFNKNSVMMVSIPDTSKSKMDYLRQELEGNPKISSVSFCYQAPSSDAFTGGSIQFDNRPWEDFSAGIIMGDSHYIKTFGLSLIAGNNLKESDTVNQALINESMLQKLGFSKPEQVLGHRLVIGGLNDRPAIIAGIVKDFNVHSLYTPIAPVLITTNRARYRYAAVVLSGQDQQQSREMIRTAWQKAYPQNAFEYRYLDEQIDGFYKKEELLAKMVNTTTVIAIIISCLGLLGLISFETLQRTKEIGIRKVLGASVADILYIFSKDFFTLLLVSIIVVSPIAWLFMNSWLQNFAYRTTISWWIFAIAALLSVLIALLTISLQAVKAAKANPVKSLRTG